MMLFSHVLFAAVAVRVVGIAQAAQAIGTGVGHRDEVAVGGMVVNREADLLCPLIRWNALRFSGLPR
jgi:hypothetical protein